MAVGAAYVFPSFLTAVLTQVSFQSQQLRTFLICFRGERRKYAGKNQSLVQPGIKQPLGHESDTLNTEPPGWGSFYLKYFTY